MLTRLSSRGLLVVRLLAAGLAGVFVLAGCASQGRGEAGDAAATAESSAELDLPPARFALSITVLDMTGRSPTAAASRGTPTWGRPARYVVESDWLLRSAVGPKVTPAGLVPPLPTDYPPITRQLGHEQAAALWGLVKSSGVMDGSAGRRVSREPDVFDPRDAAELAQEGSVVMLVEYRAGENDGRVVANAAAAGSAGLRALVSRLAEWAWVE